MLCEMCGKAPATFFFRQTKNGHTIEKNLCADCAKKQGLASEFLPFGAGSDANDDFFGNLFGSFLEEKPKIVETETCPKCGMTLSELFHNGKVGCDRCYTVFRSALMPTISKIHGNVKHCGSRPSKVEEADGAEASDAPKREPTADEKINALREQLKIAVEKQEYEDAAVLRDKIRMFEKEQEEQKENSTSNENDENGGEGSERE